MFAHRPTSRPQSADKVPGYPDVLRKERRLLIALSVIAAVASVYFTAATTDLLAPWPFLGLLPMFGIGMAGAAIVIGFEIHRSMANKLNALHGTHSLAKWQHRVDPLTGALARSYFLDALDEALARHRKNGSVALVIIDVDHFKQINDGLGHPAGDTVLEFFARSAEHAFHEATVGRLGGDEFAVFLAHEEEISEGYIEQACSAFLATLREGIYYNGRRHQLSASIGVAMAPRDDTNMRVLLSYADVALYQSKRNGRAGWSFFRKDILGDMRQERFIERELRAAILLGQLAVAYQPIVDGEGRLNSLEALVRWDHPVRGTISPAEFIPIAEKSSLIHDLGLSVLDRVCSDLRRLPDVPVNVNVSARQLRLAEFRQDYLSVLETHGVKPERIVLEITESSQLETTDKFVRRIAELRTAGFRIALDDFGLGFSEFDQLRRLPFDIIKIDKSFIQNIGLDRVTDVFVSAVVQIADYLDRKVVAEGIESSADETRAAVAGCRLFQGYHYQTPASVEDLTAKYPPITREVA